MKRPAKRAARMVALVCLCLLATSGSLALALNGLPQASSPTASPRATIQGSPLPTSVTSVAPGTASAASPTPRRSVEPPLPALVGSIGDSIGVAFDADGTFGPQPGHAWSLGTTPGDGVFSMLERIRALGGNPIAADAATAGAKIADGERQALHVLEASAQLPKGATAFVTLELGANDLCAGTSPAMYERELRSTIDLLRNGDDRVKGLPPGSRLLLLSVPDVVRLRDLTTGIPAAQNVYALAGLCRGVLSPTVDESALSAAEQRIADYNSALRSVCGELERMYGATGILHCRTDQGAGLTSMFSAQFGLSDLSTLDYFHPSLAGQAKIADGAWRASYWANVPLPGGDS